MSNVTENLKFGNYISTKLNGAILAGDVAMTVTSTANMPAVTTANGQYFYLELQQVVEPANREIVKVTDITGAVLTIVRAQDGTSALGFADSDRVRANINAALLDDIRDELKVPIDFLDYADPGATDQADTSENRSIQNLIDAAAGAQTTIQMYPGTYTVADNLTVPNNIHLVIHGGAVFDITIDSKTLTINGTLTAPNAPIRTLEATPGNRLMVISKMHPAPVEWWGVDTTSTSNNHTALDSASRGAKHLLFNDSAGYKMSSSMTVQITCSILTFRNGSYLYPGSGATVTLSNQEIDASDSKLTLWNYYNLGVIAGTIRNTTLSVHWFGAAGDGNTDDGSYIEAAIAFAAAGSTITFISGLTYQTDTINISKQIRLVGGHLRAKDTISDNGVVELAATANGSIFENMKFEVPASVTGGSGNVSGLFINGAADGVRVSNCVFEKSKSLGAVHGGIYAIGAAELMVENCLFNDPIEKGINLVNCSRCMVANNIIDTSTGDGIAVSGTGGNNSVQGNIIRTPVDAGIRATASDVVISGNVFSGGAVGTEGIVTDGSNHTITGNTLKAYASSTGSGIEVASSAAGVIISANNITGWSGSGGEAVGIASGADDIVIQGNVITGNTGTVTNGGGTDVKIGVNAGIDDVCIFRYKEDSGVDGHALLTATWEPVQFNQEALAADFASLDSYQVTLAAGTYDYQYSLILWQDGTNEADLAGRGRLFDTTADSMIAFSESTPVFKYMADGHAHNACDEAGAIGRFTIGVSSVIEIQVQVEPAGWTMGNSGHDFSMDEIYAWIKIERAV